LGVPGAGGGGPGAGVVSGGGGGGAGQEPTGVCGAMRGWLADSQPQGQQLARLEMGFACGWGWEGLKVGVAGRLGSCELKGKAAAWGQGTSRLGWGDLSVPVNRPGKVWELRRPGCCCSALHLRRWTLAGCPHTCQHPAGHLSCQGRPWAVMHG
jgi:hypothetical protein